MYTLFMLGKLWILIGILKQVGWPAGPDHCPLSKTDFFLHSLQLQIWPASQPAFDKKKHYKSFETTVRCTNITTNMPATSWQVWPWDNFFCWQFAASVVAANQPTLCSQTAAATAVHCVLFSTLPLPFLQEQFWHICCWKYRIPRNSGTWKPGRNAKFSDCCNYIS